MKKKEIKRTITMDLYGTDVKRVNALVKLIPSLLPQHITEPIKNTKSRNILILIGRGKSTLSKFVGTFNYLSAYDANRNADTIKQFYSAGQSSVIHLSNEKEYDSLEDGIKRRALKFYINF